MALVSDQTKFEGLSINGEYSSEFITCVSLYLAHFTSSQTWHHKHDDTNILSIFTVIDEALVMILLENNVDDYLMLMRQKSKLSKMILNQGTLNQIIKIRSFVDNIGRVSKDTMN